MPATFTTALPDEDQPVLLNGVEDEVGVDRESTTTNNGDVRLQIRETGQSAWDSTATGFAEFIGAFDTLTMEFVGREDGEQYEVRARTETAYRTGAWTEPVSIVTEFPGSTALSVTTASATQATLTWTDAADNEDGQLVIRERRSPDGAGWWPAETLTDVGPNTESYTDDTAQPDAEYRYRIRAFTEHTEAESNTATVTTPALDGVRDRRVPPSGWRVEVDHPSGGTLSPTVLEDAEWRPRLNDLPQVRVPVPRSSTWEDHDVEGSNMRVWKDGTRLPIGELRTVERDTTSDVLVGKGGTKLEEDVAGIEYPEEDAHVAAEEVITEELGWVANVDDPATDKREDVRLLSLDNTDEFETGLGGPDPFPETSPLTVFNGTVYATQTAVFQEAEDASGSGSETITQGGEWSGDRAIELTAGESSTFDFDVENAVPAGEATGEFVFSIPDDPTPGLEFAIDVDGGGTTTVSSFGEGTLTGTADEFDLRSFTVTLNPPDVGELPPGSHEVTVTVTEGERLILDYAHLRDDRFAYDTDDVQPVDGVVTGWQQRPAAIDVEFPAITSVEQVVAGQLDVTLEDGYDPVALGLRNDQSDAYDEETDTSSHSIDFADATQLIQARVTLGREDSTGDESGTYGDVPHRLDVLDVFADLVNTPVLIDFVHAGTGRDLLNRIADAGDFIWELRYDPDAASNYRIEWTQPGQRVADAEPTLVDFQGRRTIEGSYQRVIAEGKSSDVEGESFEANDPGLLEGLEEEPIVTGSETVYDAGDRSTTYERLVDYELDHYEGAIRILDGGEMAAGTTYEIDYEWRHQGEYTEPGVENPRETREQFPNAASDRECEQLAVAVVREVADPLEEAEVTIRETDPDRSLVASVPADQLPLEGPLKVRDVSNSAREVTLTLGSRESASDVVDEINNRLSAVARNL